MSHVYGRLPSIWAHLRRLADLSWEESKNKAVAVGDGLRAALLREARGEHYGTYLYLEFLHRFLAIFITDMAPTEAITNAAFCMSFIGYWDAAVRKLEKDDNPFVNLRSNFLTMQTKKDVLIACNAVVLATKLMREFCKEKKVRPEIALDLPAVLHCSRQAARMKQHGVREVARAWPPSRRLFSSYATEAFPAASPSTSSRC